MMDNETWFSEFLSLENLNVTLACEQARASYWRSPLSDSCSSAANVVINALLPEVSSQVGLATWSTLTHKVMV